MITHLLYDRTKMQNKWLGLGDNCRWAHALTPLLVCTTHGRKTFEGYANNYDYLFFRFVLSKSDCSRFVHLFKTTLYELCMSLALYYIERSGGEPQPASSTALPPDLPLALRHED